VNVRASLWRSIAVFRVASLAYAAVLLVTATWVAGPVLAWAVAGGIRAGVAAAVVLGACDLTLRHQSLVNADRSPALNATVLLLLAGLVVG
jgi:hypothetical protein